MRSNEPSRDAYQEALGILCPALGLPRMNHNWGIIASDGRRVTEFVEFYKTHPELEPAAKQLLGDLILASLNDALEEDLLSSDSLDRFAAFLFDVRNEQRENFAYWTSITPTIADPYPVVEWVAIVQRDWPTSSQTGRDPSGSAPGENPAAFQ